MSSKLKIANIGISLCILTAFICASMSPAVAQPWTTPEIVWQHAYGGTAKDAVKKIHLTSDGGFIMVGNTASNDGDVTVNNGLSDVWVIKTDSAGMIQWQKTYGGSAADSGVTIQQTIDGGYIVGALTYSNDSGITGNHGNSDYWIFQIDSVGTTQWSYLYGGSMYDDLESVKQTADSGFVVIGSSNSTDFDVSGNHGLYDIWVLRLNKTGGIKWEKCYGGTADDYAGDVVQAIGGDYTIAGYSASNDSDLTGNFGGFDYWILKVDAPSDTIIWQINLGGTYDEVAYSIVQNAGQGYVIVGGSNSNDSGLVSSHTGGVGPTGNYDIWVVKLTNTGGKDWENSFGGGKNDLGYNVFQASVDSSYTIICRSNSPMVNLHPTKGKTDLYVINVNRHGNIEWGRAYGGSEDDFGNGIGLLPNEEIIAAGGTFSNDSDVTGNHGMCDAWALKLGTAINLSIVDYTPYNNGIVGVYPNPFSTTANLVINTESLNGKKNILNIYNMQGEVVKSYETGNRTAITLDKSYFTSGMFYYRLESDGKVVSTGKLIAQ
ncbi:MAG: T9SS type A sorting domain-containing protein [Bacteroidia bacterium]